MHRVISLTHIHLGVGAIKITTTFRKSPALANPFLQPLGRLPRYPAQVVPKGRERLTRERRFLRAKQSEHSATSAPPSGISVACHVHWNPAGFPAFGLPVVMLSSSTAACALPNALGGKSLCIIGLQNS